MFRHFNRLALDDHRFAMNLAMFFASRILDSVLPSGSLLRSEMLTVLQQNYVGECCCKFKLQQQMNKY